MSDLKDFYSIDPRWDESRARFKVSAPIKLIMPPPGQWVRMTDENVHVSSPTPIAPAPGTKLAKWAKTHPISDEDVPLTHQARRIAELEAENAMLRANPPVAYVGNEKVIYRWNADAGRWISPFDNTADACLPFSRSGLEAAVVAMQAQRSRLGSPPAAEGPGWRYDPVTHRTYGVPVDANSLRVQPSATPASAKPPAAPKPPIPATALNPKGSKPGLFVP